MSNINSVVAAILEMDLSEGSWVGTKGTPAQKFGKDQPTTRDGVLAGKPAMLFKGKNEPAFSSHVGFLPGEKGPMLFKGRNETPPQSPHDGMNR